MAGYKNGLNERMRDEELGKTSDIVGGENLPTANIVVAGITGTGKTTLINAVFGVELAETGEGLSVTSKMEEYHNETVPIRIWDTVGLELDVKKTKESIDAIKKTIADKAESSNHLCHIHAIWYCVNSNSKRYQGGELDFIKSLHSLGVPFIIVLTQCIGAAKEVEAFEDQIHKTNASKEMKDISVVQVCAKDHKLRSGCVEAFGLDELVQTTINKLPDFIKGGFIAAQNVSRAEKRDYCGGILVRYVDDSIEGFWDKVPIVNFFTTDAKIKMMFSEIGGLYNSIIPRERIQEIIDHMGSMDIEKGILGIILPVSNEFDKKVDDFFKDKKEAGFIVPIDKLAKNERAARMLMHLGYLFLESIEELWEEKNKDSLEDIDKRVRRMKEIIDEKFNQKIMQKIMNRLPQAQKSTGTR